MILRPQSIRMRLTLWNALVGLGILVTFSGGIYQFAKAALLAQIDEELKRDLRATESFLADEPGEIAEFGQQGTVKCFAVSSTGGLAYQTPLWQKAGLEAALEAAAGVPFWSAPDGVEYRVLVDRRTILNQPTRIGVAQKAGPFRENTRALLTIILLALPAGFCLTLLGGYFLAGRMLSPVGKIAARARAITADRLSERLPVGNPGDEIGALATVLNGMLVKLEDAFERLRQFTADASHELRTPLTAIRSVGEVGLQGKHDVAEYRDIIGNMLEEVNRLARLTDSLLQLTRLDTEVVRPAAETLDVGQLVREVADSMHILAEEKVMELTVEAGDGLLAYSDRAQLRRVLMILLDNAIRYTPAGGSVTVTAQSRNGEILVEVTDNGPGIPPEFREKIFERFFRIEPGRSREPGGAGLGLSIARRAVAVCGGRIELVSEVGRGSTFRICLTGGPGQ